jgi:DNA repair protein RecN (Recombination protein N)
VVFLVSVNAGFELRPLARVSSGGELSRVMLALKSILAREDRVPTLVFDEIDAGVGGTVATAVAAQLRAVAEHHQVLVITHLPQIASRAHAHLRVQKALESGVSTARVYVLHGEERVREIARMLGGDPESQKSREHARELLACV